MSGRENRDAANTAAGLRMAAHLLGVFAAQRWTGQQIDMMVHFGGIIRDLCHHLADITTSGMNESGATFRLLVQALWNRAQNLSGLAQTQLFPPTLDPKLVVLRHLFDLARRAAGLEPRSEKEWAQACGFLAKHNRDMLPADRPHMLCDPTLQSQMLWNFLPAAGARLLNDVPEHAVVWYQNAGTVPQAQGLHCTDVRFVPCEISSGRYAIELAEAKLDHDSYRADLSVALSLVLMQPYLLRQGRLYLFSGVSRTHGDRVCYPLVRVGVQGGEYFYIFSRPVPGEEYFSVRIAK